MRVKILRKGLLSVALIAALMMTSVFIMPVYADTPTGTVVYDANGGTGGTEVNAVAEGSTPGFPNVSRTGYTLTGWFDAQTGGNKVTASTPIKFNGNPYVTFYAQWKGKKVKVTYNANGGALKKNAKKTKQVTVGEKYGKLASPTRVGYKFKGWYIGKTKITAGTVVAKTGAHKLKAKWLQKGTGKTITKAEYKRLKMGMSPADAKYTVGGVQWKTKMPLEDGTSFLGYEWISSTSKSVHAVALFYEGQLVWKAWGTEKQILSKYDDWLNG